MRLVPYVALALLGLASACKVTTVASQLPPSSSNPFGNVAGTAWVLPVSALKRNQTPPSFGPYHVSNLRRGWTTISTNRTPLRVGATSSPLLDLLALPYNQVHTTESSRSQFHFADSLGHAAEVYISTEVVTQAISTSPSKSSELSEVQKTAASFSAIIVGPQLGATNAWSLLLSFPNQLGFPSDPTATLGLVGDAEQVLYRVRLTPHPPLISPSGQPVPWPATAGPGGIELLQQGQRVAYIDYATARPAVWLRDDLSPDARFLAATVLSTIMFRTSW